MLKFNIIQNALLIITNVSKELFDKFENKNYTSWHIIYTPIEKDSFFDNGTNLFSRCNPRYTLNGVTSWCLTDKDMLGYYFYKVGSAKAEQEVKLQTLDKMRALPTKH